jgi:DNA-binding GntR family transcriptional regulator
MALQDVKPATLQSQRELVEAIASRDKRRAAAVMQSHITQWSEWYVQQP